MKPKYTFGDVLYYPTYNYKGEFDNVAELKVKRIEMADNAIADWVVYSDGWSNAEERRLFRTKAEAQICAYHEIMKRAACLVASVEKFKELAEAKDGKVSMQG